MANSLAMANSLQNLAQIRRDGKARGVTSVCSAHPVVLRAALRFGRDNASTVLIEATCNQVNHLGGYTGLRPADFAELVWTIAREENCPAAQIILGGDHLGPSPWKDKTADEAMAEAELMVAAYVSAGFQKIHLDPSMGCMGEPAALDDYETAARAVRLAGVAETTARDSGVALPLYVIGTEVPPPGGADHFLQAVTPTGKEAAKKTIEVHRSTFAKASLSDAFGRVIGIVVQPGVEFGNHNVIQYDRSKARDLSAFLSEEQQLVFEAHSTDYQGVGALTELVADGFAILKVGPELTFVLREALYALDAIASDLLPDYGDRPLMRAMEALMLKQPEYWERHYAGDQAHERLLRHYSLSDRIRYYWPMPDARAAVSALFSALKGASVPLPLIWQHLPNGDHFANSALDPEEVIIWRVTRSLATYHAACQA